MLAGQGIEESDDFTNFIGAQHAPQLQLGHHVHGILQFPVSTMVEIGIRQLSVTQDRHFEPHPVSGSGQARPGQGSGWHRVGPCPYSGRNHRAVHSGKQFTGTTPQALKRYLGRTFRTSSTSCW